MVETVIWLKFHLPWFAFVHYSLFLLHIRLPRLIFLDYLQLLMSLDVFVKWSSQKSVDASTSFPITA